MSLRRRLVAGMLALVVAGIVTTDLVTSSSLRSFLYGRLDEQIDVAQDSAYGYIEATYERALAAAVPSATSDEQAWLAKWVRPRSSACLTVVPPSVTSAPSPATDSPDTTTTPRDARLSASFLAARLGPDDYVEIIDDNGHVVFQRPSGSCASQDPPPILPRALPVQASPPAQQFGSHHGAYVPDRPAFDVPTKVKGTTYRVEAVAVPGGTLITAVPLDPTNQTLDSLIHVEVIVSIVVVLTLLVLALWIVRFGLRPLEEMTETAGAIAAGDLTRRVRRPEERGEVGRLGSALNGMLSQIEAAFAERTSSESRLRRFVADASHELRTPLTSIRGYAELLRKGAFPDEAARRRAAERIEHEASRMGLLVDDLLLLARLDQGRPLERFTVDLGVVVRDAVEAARAVDGGRRISLEVSGPVLVDGDAARLRQVVDNLLRNAIVHTPMGTPVHVSVRCQDERAVISVADEGPGLATDQADRLFDRFYRGSEARTGEGTGLGLSIVAALVTAHGGHALVRSTPGMGTVFTVELPAAAVTAAVVTVPDQPAGLDERDTSDPPMKPESDVGGRWIMVSDLFVTDRGQGPLVLAVHGQPGSADDWEAVVAQLVIDHRVLVADRPGYGRTGGSALGMADNADLLAQLLVDRATGPATIIGHSYGGGIAALMACRHPEVVSGLVLVGSVGRADSVNVLDHVLALPGVGEFLAAAGLLSFGRLLPRLRGLVTHVPGRRLAWLEANIPDRRLREGGPGRGSQIRRSFVIEQRALVREIGDVESALTQITMPTVVVSGTWDVVVPLSVAATIATDVAGAELVTVPRTGHFVPRDAPQVVATAVRRVEARSTGVGPDPSGSGEEIGDTGS